MIKDQMPEIIDGIKCYAPELAYSNENYSPETFDKIYREEDKNFWFRSRNSIISSLVKKIIIEKEHVNFLEIGCGTGYVLKGLSQLRNIELQGSDLYLQGLKYARKRLPGIELIQVDAANIPFEKTFDVVGAFDVLEHIENDRKVMHQVNSALRQNGYFIISVPQHPFMWSYLDDMAFHKRRYTRKEIKHKLIESGFKITFITSFIFLLFPMMMISRFLKKKKSVRYDVNTQMAELKLPQVINSLFYFIMKIEELLIRSGLSLPFGGSLIVVARKSDRPT